MVDEYLRDIVAAGGVVPDYLDDPFDMQIAKLDDALRKARRRSA